MSFSKRAYESGIKQQTFDFLGFTFYLGKSRKGVTIPKTKTSKKRVKDKLSRVKEWICKVRNQYRLMQIWKMFCIKLKGYIGYYGISFNVGGVQEFLEKAKKILFKWLNQRSQKKSFNWEDFKLFMQRYPMPKARVVHALY